MDDTTARRAQPFQPQHVLVAGAHGVGGALVMAALLRDTGARITGLVAPGHAPGDLVRGVAEAWERQSGGRWSPAVERRLAWRTLPADTADLPDLAPALADVDEIVHCAAGAGSVPFTAHLVLLARRLAPRRMLHLAARCPAGCGGAAQHRCDGRACQAERLVAAGGVPYVVIRPTTERRPRHRTRRHADAFCAAFQAAHRWLADGARAVLRPGRPAGAAQSADAR